LRLVYSLIKLPTRREAILSLVTQRSPSWREPILKQWRIQLRRPAALRCQHITPIRPSREQRE